MRSCSGPCRDARDFGEWLYGLLPPPLGIDAKRQFVDDSGTSQSSVAFVRAERACTWISCAGGDTHGRAGCAKRFRQRQCTTLRPVRRTRAFERYGVTPDSSHRFELATPAPHEAAGIATRRGVPRDSRSGIVQIETRIVGEPSGPCRTAVLRLRAAAGIRVERSGPGE